MPANIQSNSSCEKTNQQKILQDSSNKTENDKTSSQVLESSTEKTVDSSDDNIDLKCINAKMDVDDCSLEKGKMAIESMDVDSIDEKRENLKRQRDSSFESKSTVANEFIGYDQSNSISSTIISMISDIFYVNLAFNESDPCDESKITIQLYAFKQHSNSAHDYKNMVQAILMETTCNLISDKSSFEENLAYFNKLKCESTTSFINSLTNTNSTSEDNSVDFLSYRNRYVLGLSYILDCIHKVYGEEKMTVDKCESPLIRDVVAAIKNQCFEYCSYVITESESDSYLINFIIQMMYQGKLHYDFMYGFISTTYHSSSFKKIFVPILQNIWLDMQAYCSLTLENHYKLPLQVLHELCSVCIGKSNYPIGEIVSNRINDDS